MIEDQRKEWLAKCEQLKQMFLRCARNEPRRGTAYAELRQQVRREPELADKLPICVEKFDNLYHFHDHLQHPMLFKSEQDRVAYVEKAFAPLICSLAKTEKMPSDEMITKQLAGWSSAGVVQNWQKCLERRSQDPDGAITAARSLLEAVCKHVLDEKGVQYGENTDIPKLYNLVATQLNIAPSQQTDDVFKRIAGGCSSVVEGLGALRNKLGDSHGKSTGAISVNARHAQLAVNLAGSMAVFLAETWEATK